MTFADGVHEEQRALWLAKTKHSCHAGLSESFAKKWFGLGGLGPQVDNCIFQGNFFADDGNNMSSGVGESIISQAASGSDVCLLSHGRGLRSGGCLEGHG